MALVEKFHVVAAERIVAVGQTITEGAVVSLNTSGEVVIQDNSTNTVAYGIAGDTKSTTASGMPGITDATVGARDSSNAVTQGFQNRASDYYDETKASSKMTVYHSGGEFATDQFASNVASATPFAALYARSGLLDTVDAAGGTDAHLIIARLTQADGAYPSGVPGIDVNGDQALQSARNDDTYIEFKLLV